MQDLQAVGEYIFGEVWQRALARELPCNPRTVRRWVIGEKSISNDAWLEILNMAANKKLQEILDIKALRGSVAAQDLIVYSNAADLESHPRNWTYQTDLEIKTLLADMLKKEGIEARVVEK